MTDYLRRLLSAGAAYQLAEIVAKFIALALLPLYTRHLSQADYGAADLLLTLVILVSILVRGGMVEAFQRYWFERHSDEDRDRLARAATGLVLLATTALAALSAALAPQLSRAVLGFEDTTLWLIATLGLWTFTNLEMAYALLRVEERKRAYLRASMANVALTVCFTVYLVVFADQGARGLLGGNFAASTIVLLGLWWTLRHRVGVRVDRAQLPQLLRFGLPTVPAEASVFALNIVDRLYLFRLESEADAGLFSLAVKLSAVVIFATRAFQYAWPPLAYSIREDREASRLYAFVTTYYVLATGLVIAAIALLGRWVVRVFAAPDFFDAYQAMPWVALGWGLYGLWLVLIVVAGRVERTTRNFPAAAVGLGVNVGLLFLLVPPLGISGAGIALCGAYVAMVGLMHLLTRRLFAVDFEWRRLAQLVVVIAGATVAGELALPTSGAVGLLARAAVVAAIPAVLWASGFFHPQELARLRALAERAMPRRAR